MGDEHGVLEAGGLGVVPPLVPHERARRPAVVSVFDDPMLPAGKRVVGSPLPQESEVAVVGAA